MFRLSLSDTKEEIAALEAQGAKIKERWASGPQLLPKAAEQALLKNLEDQTLMKKLGETIH